MTRSDDTKGVSIIMRRLRYFLLTLFTSFSLAACGGGDAPAGATTAPAASSSAPTTAPVATNEVKLVRAVFARSLDENQAPVDETASFQPDETIYFSMEFEGRPKTGKVEATFYFRDNELARANVDFADANSGVLVSFGQSTFVGFNLTHANPLPISENYRVEASLNGKKLADYPFKMVEPTGSLASKIAEVVLARGATESYEAVDPTTEFGSEDTVFLVGKGDLGNQSWVQADWYVDGKLDTDGTRSLTMNSDTSDGSFAFSYLPEGGWPLGKHEVTLTLNDAVVERLNFTIVDPASAVPAQPGDFVAYASDDGVFSIDVPSNWEQSASDIPGMISTAWIEANGTAAVFVQITTEETELTVEDLVARVEEYVQSTYSQEPGFSMDPVEEQADGSQRMLWNASPNIGGTPTALTGLTFIEQRGDKLSLLTVVVPAEGSESQEPLIDRIINTYKVNPTAKIK